ncbi:MAG: S24/S26 family peptidase [Candidatus Omnitrophica bacterium]|nr:S24/S26 family peptidase [Candidatus Omnitrophota bacterium]
MFKKEKPLDFGIDDFKKILIKGQNLTLRVKGNSMWPFLKDNQIISVARTDFDNIKRGDILLCYCQERIFCHRLFLKKASSFITKGDAMFGFDPEFDKDQLLGKVVKKESKGIEFSLDTAASRSLGIFIGWSTLLVSPLFPVCRFFRRQLLKLL